MDERKIVEDAIAAREGAFEQLYGLYYKKLYKYAAYTLRTLHDAEDAVSETVCVAYAGIAKLNNPEYFGSWIFKILSNICKKKMREYYLHGNKEEDEEGTYPDYLLNYQVKEMFMSLPYRERMVVGLSVFAGYDSREIAGILKLNPNTVRSIRKRTLEKLAKQLDD